MMMNIKAYWIAISRFAIIETCIQMELDEFWSCCPALDLFHPFNTHCVFVF